jgi:Ca-activated chloride channel family protein
MIKNSILFSAFFLIFVFNSYGQSVCFTPEEAKKVIESMQAPLNSTENKDWRKELLSMQDDFIKLNQKIIENPDKKEKLIPEARNLGEKNLLRICQMLKENGWSAASSVKSDGFEAMISLIKTSRAYNLQRQIFPVLLEAAKKDFIKKDVIASLIDTIRISVNLPQIFGTQATIKDNIVYIFPLLNEKKIDEWRKMYDLNIFSTFLRQMEFRYQMPVVKMSRMPIPPDLRKRDPAKNFDEKVLGIQNSGDEDVVKVDSFLVNLNVRVLNKKDLSIPNGLELKKEDFVIFEEGISQEIEYFTTTDVSFDLVLLLDFSGSTVNNRDLVKKAAQRFVEYARPNDRIAVVVFATQIKIVCELTSDKKLLNDRIKDIDAGGGSPIWDSLKYTYENIIKKESLGRRSAIVFMTDAMDGSRQTTFADALEIAKSNDSTIFSVYLNNFAQFSSSVRFYERYGRMLWMLAEETGGEFYKADSFGDLKGIYEKVINDLGKVHSIGYTPKTDERDGAWRKLEVKIKNRDDLVVKSKRGYYAK